MVKKEIRYPFGDKLRLVRERKKITLKHVAEKAGVSESLVSQIERNKVSPSIDTLMTIADVLEIDLEYLFRDFKKDKKVSIVRVDERDSITQQDVTYHQLSMMADPGQKHAIEAFLLEIAPQGEKGDMEYGHAGMELGIILEGQGQLTYGSSIYGLKKGDSISFPSDIPHIFKNTGKGILRAIWVITPPRMFFLKK